MKGVKVSEDDFAFYLKIEKRQETRELIDRIMTEFLNGITAEKLDGLMPGLPIVEPQPEYTPSKAYVGYVEALGKYKRGELEGEEKANTLAKIKKMAEIMKKGRPQKDDDLKYCVFNMSEVFSQRIQDAVLAQMGMSLDDLKKADIPTLEKAYNLAITV